MDPTPTRSRSTRSGGASGSCVRRAASTSGTPRTARWGRRSWAIRAGRNSRDRSSRRSSNRWPGQMGITFEMNGLLAGGLICDGSREPIRNWQAICTGRTCDRRPCQWHSRSRTMAQSAGTKLIDSAVEIAAGPTLLHADLTIPDGATGLVLFATAVAAAGTVRGTGFVAWYSMQLAWRHFCSICSLKTKSAGIARMRGFVSTSNFWPIDSLRRPIGPVETRRRQNCHSATS